MKNVFSLALGLVFVCSSFAQDGDEKPLFDMEAMDTCTICKCMSDIKTEMMNIKWESHLVDNGLMTVTVVPDNLKEKWGKCKKCMDETVEGLKGDEELCNFCTKFGGLIQDGAKKQELDTAGGQILLITSDKPELVKKIKALGKKMAAEQKQMKAMMEKMMQSQKG